MNTIKSILTRRSIRKYKKRKVSNQKINQILKAAMYAPSAMNYQPWHFIVLNKRVEIDHIYEINPHAELILKAPAAVIVCGDSKLEINIDLLVQDCSAATQNALLAIHELGLGGVWVNSFPNKDTVDGLRKYYGIPENLIPVSIIAIGYPAEKPAVEERFNTDRIHINKW